MYEYPFGNGQQLNLDWFLAEWKNLLTAWEAEKNGIAGSLDAEIAKAEAALADVFAARDAAAQSAANALESKNAAAQSASDASGYLATVRADANTASNAAQNAAQSESNAAESAQTALASKNTAAQSEANANSSKNAAAQSAADALANKDAAAQSAADALANKDAAAQSAEDASDAAASVEASAQQITTNANDIVNLKTATKQLSNGNIVITEFVEGEYVRANTGEFAPSNPDARTGLVKIPDGMKTLRITSPEESPYNAFYSSDNTSSYVAQLRYPVGTSEISIPPTAHYFALSTSKANIRNVQVQGNTEYKINATNKIIAPVLENMIADTALVVNDFRIVENTLYRIIAPVANGGALTIGTNVVATTVADVLKSLLN